jgi:hypothetical protein
MGVNMAGGTPFGSVSAEGIVFGVGLSSRVVVFPPIITLDIIDETKLKRDIRTGLFNSAMIEVLMVL